MRIYKSISWSETPYLKYTDRVEDELYRMRRTIKQEYSKSSRVLFL